MSVVVPLVFRRDFYKSMVVRAVGYRDEFIEPEVVSYSEFRERTVRPKGRVPRFTDPESICVALLRLDLSSIMLEKDEPVMEVFDHVYNCRSALTHSERSRVVEGTEPTLFLEENSVKISSTSFFGDGDESAPEESLCQEYSKENIFSVYVRSSYRGSADHLTSWCDPTKLEVLQFSNLVSSSYIESTTALFKSLSGTLGKHCFKSIRVLTGHIHVIRAFFEHFDVRFLEILKVSIGPATIRNSILTSDELEVDALVSDEPRKINIKRVGSEEPAYHFELDTVKKSRVRMFQGSRYVKDGVMEYFPQDFTNLTRTRSLWLRDSFPCDDCVHEYRARVLLLHLELIPIAGPKSAKF